MRNLYYLSFCDPDKPRGEQFLGACIVPASDIVTAVRVAHLLGCNPGGEVLGQPCGDGEKLVKDHHIGRLMQKRELSEAFGS